MRRRTCNKWNLSSTGIVDLLTGYALSWNVRLAVSLGEPTIPVVLPLLKAMPTTGVNDGKSPISLESTAAYTVGSLNFAVKYHAIVCEVADP